MSLIETLEGRKLLSVSVHSQENVDGTYTLVVSNAQDVEVNQQGAGIQVIDRTVPDGGSNQTYTLGSCKVYSAILINGTTGADRIALNVADFHGTIYGNNGSDLLQAYAGGSGNIAVFGGNASDWIIADGTLNATGVITIDGGNGSDTIDQLGGTVDIIPSNGKDIV